MSPTRICVEDEVNIMSEPMPSGPKNDAGLRPEDGPQEFDLDDLDDQARDVDEKSGPGALGAAAGKGPVVAMLAECRRHIGYREDETTPFGVWYGDKVGSAAYDGAPWCDMFLSYCADRSDNLASVGLFAYTPHHVNWFKGLDRWYSGKSGIRAGDIIFFDWDGGVVDHVGIVEKVLSRGRLQTIEGNTENMCRRRIRAGSIEGYGRPDYAGDGESSAPAAV
jgi:hypothetical protein